MILTFSGDPFLAHRAARDALREAGFAPSAVTEVGEGLEPGEVANLAGQAGLFGPVAILLDFDAAFVGQAGVKPRNDTLKALEALDADAAHVVIVDSGASDARARRYRALGDVRHLPTPKYERLPAWVRDELTASNVRFTRGVPELLADLFGGDLPGIASEVRKLAVLDEELDEARVRFLAHRPAARDAFALIEAAVAGRAADALAIARTLANAGEPPQRVLGALSWQFDLVARCVGIQARDGRPRPDAVARELKVKPFPAKKALAIAGRLDETSLRRVLQDLVEAEVAAKTGRDPHLALEQLTLRLAASFERRAA